MLRSFFDITPKSKFEETPPPPQVGAGAQHLRETLGYHFFQISTEIKSLDERGRNFIHLLEGEA